MIDQEFIQDNIDMMNTESSTDQIICPYCQNAENVEYEMCFGDTSVDVYDEGEQWLKCPECRNVFKLIKEHIFNYYTYIPDPVMRYDDHRDVFVSEAGKEFRYVDGTMAEVQS